MELDSTLVKQLIEIARAKKLLIISDFDGTLVPFSADPQLVKLSPTAHQVLHDLSNLPQTNMVIVSGRGLSDLKTRAQAGKTVCIGSHGWEFEEITLSTSSVPDPSFEKAKELFSNASLKLPGSFIEIKPSALALHYRAVTIADIPTVTDELREGLLAIKSGMVRDGKFVVEYSSHTSNKGDAVKQLQNLYKPDATIFLGDDITDESAFVALKGTGVTVKVGLGETAAHERVKNEQDIYDLLAFLLKSRSRYLLKGEKFFPIADYFFISDLQTGALIAPDTNIAWLCLPAFDSSPLFHGILDGVDGGTFSISVDGMSPADATYEPDSLITKFRWENAQLTDFFYRPDPQTQENKKYSSQLLRTVKGTGRVEIRFSPRINFGKVPFQLTVEDRGITITGASLSYQLSASGWEWKIDDSELHPIAIGTKILHEESDTIEFCAAYQQNDSIASTTRYNTTKYFWNSWLEKLTIPAIATDQVKRSALALRGLIYEPTGSIIAALTTSLPENIGGGRNWDYRFCWPRDASLTATALLKLGSHDPALALIEWMMKVTDREDGAFLNPIYSISGHEIQGEAELPEVFGYLGSQPVRIGNLAAGQLQLDVLAPVVELLALMVESYCREEDAPRYLLFIEKIIMMVSNRWKEPDCGIWEIRTSPQHYVHSKLMCWYTLKNALIVAKTLNHPSHHEWEALMSAIRADIEQNGFSENVESYVCAYGQDEPDAALLWLVLTGFHEPNDPRLIKTLDYVVEHLVKDGFLYRYLFKDGLHGEEGAFLICQAWLVEALCLQGRIKEAEIYFEKLLSAGSYNNIYAEQFDPISHQALGNVPQAYSHLGIINAALALEKAKKVQR